MENRRSFIQKTGMAAAGVAALQFDLLAKQRLKIGANGKINVGAIGINGMGWSDLK